MAINFLNNLDLNQNQVKNFRVDVSGSAPDNHGEGSLWYDSTHHMLKFYVLDDGSGASPAQAGWLAVRDSADDLYLKNNANDTTTGVLTAAGFTTTGTWTIDTSGGATAGITNINVGDTFTDDDVTIMSAGAIKEKIEAYGYATSTGTVDTSGTPADDEFAKFTDSNTVEGRSYSEVRTDLGLVIGTNVQAWDAQLDSLAGWTAAQVTTLGTIGTVTTAANKMIYTTAADTFAETSITSAARNLLDDADAAAMRTTLGVDASGADNSTNVTLATVANNYLSISGQAITAGTVPVGLGGTGATTASGARSALDVDAAGTDNSTNVTLATVSSNYLSISGQAITAGNVPISLGGTGQTTASGAANALLNTSQGTALTIGDSNDIITIPGDLVVTGDTTTNNVTTVTTSNGVVFEGASADNYDGTLKSVVAGANVTYTLPNVGGYVALFSADPSTTAISATVAELNYVDGVTSNIQTQLDAKQAADAELTELATMGSTTAAALADLTQDEVQILDGATLSTAELNYVDGVTSAIQTQIDSKQASGSYITGSGSLSAQDLTDIGNLSNTNTGDQTVTDSTSTTSSTTVASATAVKSAYDRGTTGVTNAATAQTTADAALPEADVDADIKTLSLPANTTISAFGKTLVDDADAATARTTLGVMAASDKVSKLLEGHASNTTYNIEHNLNTTLVKTTVLDYGNASSGATYAIVYPEVKYNSADSVDVVFGRAPGTSQDYIVVCERMPAV
jgi:hypothetical protein